MSAGLFVVLEGIDGSGKTSVAKLLKGMLEKEHFSVAITREPTYFEVGALLRNYLKNYDLYQRDPIYEALLFAADRVYHVNRFIKPLLNRGYIVISDRYVYSSIVYQTIDGVSEKWIQVINKFALEPDLPIFIDVSPEVALKRLGNRKSMFENLGFLKRVYNKYLELVRSGALVSVDGTRDINKITEEIYSMVISLWRKKNNT